MEISLIVRNIVAVGNFSPSKFDKFYFIKNQIFDENELENAIFGEYYVQVITDNVTLIVSTANLSITLKNFEESLNADGILKKIVESNPISCTAIGLNFEYYMFVGEKLEETSRKYFYQKNRLVDEFFNTDDAAFGFYVSKDFRHARLKLDINPQLVFNTINSESQNVISFQFNFHADLIEETSAKQILEILQDTPLYFEESQKIMNLYNDN